MRSLDSVRGALLEVDPDTHPEVPRVLNPSRLPEGPAAVDIFARDHLADGGRVKDIEQVGEYTKPYITDIKRLLCPQIEVVPPRVSIRGTWLDPPILAPR